MSDIKQTLAGTLKTGSYVLFDNIPCVVKSIQISKTGKHGHAKCRIEAIGIINKQKIIKIMPASDKVDVPIIEKKSAQVLSISGDTANIMDMETYETFDLKIPEDLEVREGSQIIYWIIMDEKIIKQVK
jgi:translation initiation factor 5A